MLDILGFSSCTWVDFGDYRLLYPTSRNLYLDHGIQMRESGIQVDITIPWTPEHLTHDVMLEAVLALIDEA